MGQSQSSPSPSSPVRETTASYDDLQRAAPASSSGVTLAPELEGTSVRVRTVSRSTQGPAPCNHPTQTHSQSPPLFVVVVGPGTLLLSLVFAAMQRCISLRCVPLGKEAVFEITSIYPYLVPPPAPPPPILLVSLSFVFPTPDDIIRDFQNHLVQAEWNAFRAGLLDRRNERMSNARTALAQKQAQWNDEKQRRDFKMAQLDAILDEAAAKVTDTTVALSHDMKVLERKVQEAERPPSSSSSSVGGGTGRVVPCLGPRAHWVDCAHKYEFDPRPCDAYLAALERCVQDAVVGQVIRSTSTSTKQ